MNKMGIIFLWIIFSFVVGWIGSKRNIGFWGAFLLSLLLSPLVGLIIALISKNIEDEAYKEKILQAQRRQKEALDILAESKRSESSTKSVADELEKLKKLKDEGVITEEEFEKLRNKLINS